MDDAFHATLRARFRLVPGASPRLADHDGVGYVGRDFRVYEYMQVGFARRFYATLHERWDADGLATALQIAGLDDHFDVRRMKRAYKRALVLAFALAATPRMLVVEGAEEFDEAGARALLAHAIETVPAVVVTYGPETAIEREWYTRVVAARDVEFDAVASSSR